jgi:catechol 2,3-dioxygenase-like lactoylglutathione lyase family enzyme
MTFATGHVGINVTNLDRSRDFYTSVLDLRQAGGSDEAGRRYAFLGDEHGLVLTLWEQSQGRFSEAAPGLHHLSFQVSSIDEVRSAERRLRARGAKFVYDGVVPHAEGLDSGGIFFEDPDGTRLEIFATTGARGKAQSDGPACGFF